MPFFADDISFKVFKRSVSDNFSEITLSGPMLKVLIALDGKKNLGTIQHDLKTDVHELNKIIRNLESRKLIEKVTMSPPIVNTDFFVFLRNHLTRAMGPIAEFIMEEELQNFNVPPREMTLQSAAELVDLLARQILREEKRIAFQQTMVEKIKEFKS